MEVNNQFCEDKEILIKTASSEQSQVESFFNSIWSGLSVGMGFVTLVLFKALTLEKSCFCVAVSVEIV